MVRSISSADQRVDLAFQRQLVEVAGELVQRIALRLAALLAFTLTAGHARGRLVADLGDAVRNVIDHVEPGDFLLVHEIHRVRILLAEDRHQHVRAGDFLPAGGLHVIHRALQHALEAQRGLRIALVAGRQHRHGLVDDAFQVGRQPRQVHAAGAQGPQRRLVFGQREQQVLYRHEFMALFAGLLVAMADGDFQILAEHSDRLRFAL
jgi:hypothetical protein